MCEIVKSARRKVAKEDIIVYKILIKESNALLAPYHSGVEYKVNKIQYANIKCELFLHTIIRTCDGLHSFQDVKSAIKHRIMLQFWFSKDNTYTIYKALIPKGTKYLLTNYDKDNVYISEQLKIIEEIKTI